MNAPILVLVGGMLGAGKTGLILEAARRLQGRGRRVGVITNDQGQNVVDASSRSGGRVLLLPALGPPERR